MSNPKRYRIFSTEKPSDTIRCVAAENSSTDSAQMADCEACGRTHLSKNWRDGLDEQTINFLEISLEENPGKYVLTGCEEPIFYTNFGGKEIVLECPCNFLKSVENRWLSQRELIEDFFNRLDTATKSELRAVRRRGVICIARNGNGN